MLDGLIKSSLPRSGHASLGSRRMCVDGVPPFLFWNGVDGKFYTSHQQLQGPFDTILDLYREARLLSTDDRSKPRVVALEEPSTRPRSIRRSRAQPSPSPSPSPSPVVALDLQQPTPPLENIVADVAESSSALTLQELDASSVEELPKIKSFESITAAPRTVLQNTIDGSSSTFLSSCEKPLEGAAEFASALTLQEQDVSSSDQFNISSVEVSITASSRTLLHNTIDGSSITLPSSCEKLLIDDAGSAPALTLQEPDEKSSEELLDTIPLKKSIVAALPTVPHSMTGISPPSASSLGSPIFIRNPPRWHQTFYIRMDRGGLFHMYPKLKGPFQSLQEAEADINHHLDEWQRASGLKQRHEVSPLDWMIQECCFYPDGMPKKGPNSPARKNPNHHHRCLIQALLDQYNEDHDLFQDVAHELKDLLNFQWILEGQRSYYHFNFTTKTKKADDNNLFFAEVLRVLRTDNWVVSCCCMIKENDNGHCNGCINNGSPELKHPKNKHSFVGGHKNGYLPFGGDTCSDSDDEDMDAFVARLKFKFGSE